MIALEEYERDCFQGEDYCTWFEFWAYQIAFTHPDHVIRFIKKLEFAQQDMDFLAGYATKALALAQSDPFAVWTRQDWQTFTLCLDYMLDNNPLVYQSWEEDLPT